MTSILLQPIPSRLLLGEVHIGKQTFRAYLISSEQSSIESSKAKEICTLVQHYLTAQACPEIAQCKERMVLDEAGLHIGDRLFGNDKPLNFDTNANGVKFSELENEGQQTSQYLSTNFQKSGTALTVNDIWKKVKMSMGHPSASRHSPLSQDSPSSSQHSHHFREHPSSPRHSSLSGEQDNPSRILFDSEETDLLLDSPSKGVSNKKAENLYSSYIPEAFCNAGTVTYVPSGVDGPLTKISLCCASAGLAFLTGLGSIFFGIRESWNSLKELKNQKDMTGRATFTARVVSLLFWVINGLAAVGSALSALWASCKDFLLPLVNFAPIAGIIAAGIGLIADIKDLICLLKAEKLDLKKIGATLCSMLANICMLLAPILLLALAGSCPPAALFAIILALGIMSVISHVVREWEWFKQNWKIALPLMILLLVVSLIPF